MVRTSTATLTLEQCRVSDRKGRRRRDSRIAAASGYQNTAPSPKAFTPGSSPRFDAASYEMVQRTFQTSSVGQSPDRHLDFIDVAHPGDFTNFNSYDAIDAFDHPITTSPILLYHPYESTSPLLNERTTSASSQYSPYSHISLDMSWSQGSPFARSSFNDGNASSQGGHGEGASSDAPLRSPVGTGSPGFERLVEGENNPFDFSPANDQLFNDSFATGVSSPELYSAHMAVDALLFGDDNIDHAYTDYDYPYFTQESWASGTTHAAPQQISTITSGSLYAPHHSHLFSSTPFHVLQSSPSPSLSPQQQRNGGLRGEAAITSHAGNLSPFMETDHLRWPNESSNAPSSTYALSHNSPQSRGSPASHASPGFVEAKHQTHVAGVDTRFSKPKGRQRSLTSKEKKDAREVRDAKACWACHISKTKCSPCRPGNPCEQCARLAGKRRFCKFECFNDPLEALYTFMVPEYSMARFQEKQVASLLAKVVWGTSKLKIRLSWGHSRSLEASVVHISLRDQQSNPLAFQHQVLTNGQNKPMLLRKESPPLGIPQEVVNGLESICQNYVAQIVDNDLPKYVSESAYLDDDSALPKRLLWAFCSFYSRYAAVAEECDLLRRAIEMHITSTILQRSLVLEPDCVQEVETYLRSRIPERSVPKCAARQIKFTFFTIQRRRITSVLKEWGSLMWTIHNSANNADRWSVGFSVFMVLILTIDKTLGAAYSLCESRIEHRDASAEAERVEFRQLVRLTETSLFERCKEIFHWKFKTRKGGKEACNPIRDGMAAFKGKAVSDNIKELVKDLQKIAQDFEQEIHNQRTMPLAAADDVPYTDIGRLACVFLHDFIGDN